jgi:hypothetical protein
MEGRNQNDEQEKLLAKANSVSIMSPSGNIKNDALYYVGQSLKNIIIESSLFGFEIRGNIFRHPGEIIKFNSLSKREDSESEGGPIDAFDSQRHGFSLCYVTSVTHSFSGNNFNDIIYATKICNLDGVERPSERTYETTETENIKSEETKIQEEVKTKTQIEPSVPVNLVNDDTAEEVLPDDSDTSSIPPPDDSNPLPFIIDPATRRYKPKPIL